MNIAIRSVSKTYPSQWRGEGEYEEKAVGKVVTDRSVTTLPAIITKRSGSVKTIRAVNDCSLTVEDGSFTVIAGRSGCGKTTLLKIIAGLEQADSGMVEFSAGENNVNDRSVTTKPPVANKTLSGETTIHSNVTDRSLTPLPGLPKIGFMFQDHRLLPWLTIEQNLALAFPHPKDKADKAAVQREIARALAMTGIGDRAAALPRELSGGMAQRAALARCLCRKPSLLLLDEPLSSLDAFTKIRLRGELEKLRQELKLTVILVTHDIEDAVFFGDTIFVMNRGSIARSISVPLPRPRDCRSGEFQRRCRELEDAVCAESEEEQA